MTKDCINESSMSLWVYYLGMCEILGEDPECSSPGELTEDMIVRMEHSWINRENEDTTESD